MKRFLLCGALAMATQPFHTVTPQDGRRDFDFEFGSWKAHLSRLDHPLTGSTRWLEYKGASVVRRPWTSSPPV